MYLSADLVTIDIELIGEPLVVKLEFSSEFSEIEQNPFNNGFKNL